MALEVIDSIYGDYKKQLNDLILIILAKEYPLKIGEICHRLQNEFHITLSFQAVRKSLNVMVERKILALNNKTYCIEKNYALELKRLTDQAMNNYFSGHKENKSLPTQKAETISTYEFEDLIKVDQFWAEIVLDWMYNLKEADERVVLFHGPHCWYMFGHLALEYNYISELQKHNIKLYYLINGTTLLDKWASQFYSPWATYKINPKRETMKTVIGVFGDFIIQYDYPDEIYNKMEEFYTQAKTLESIDLNNIAALLKSKSNIKVVVMKNKVIAAKLKEEMKSKFSVKKS